MKRSLHIGINDYPGTNSDLSGCVNDAKDWEEVLSKHGFQTVSLLDEEAKKSDMVKAITNIVTNTGKNDIAVITYSGHGTWTYDEDGDEVDGRDEALCPYDIAEGNILSDDTLHEIFSQRVRGARIIFISDSCHSGSVAKANHFMPGTQNDNWKFPKIRFLSPEVYLKKNTTLLSTYIY